MRTFSLLASRLVAILNPGPQGLLARGAGLLGLTALWLLSPAHAATPTIVSVTFPPPGTYGPADGTLTFTVQFSEAVRLNTHGGVGVPQLMLEVGSTEIGRITSPPAAILSFGSIKTYTFDVGPGHLDTDGIRVLRYDALGGSYDNGNGEPADLTIPGGPLGSSVLVDGVGPAAAAPVLDAASDLGPFNNDRITSDNTPTFTGVTEPGATVQFFSPNGTVTADGAGNWSFTVGSPLTEGVKFISSIFRDARGNQTFNPSLSVTIDTTPPVCSSISRASPNPSNADSVNYTVTFSEDVYGLSLGSFDLVYTGNLGAGSASVTQLDARTYTVNLGAIVGAGTMQLNLKPSGTGVMDLAGNEPAGKTGQIYAIDRWLPTVTSFGLLPAHDTGVPNDGITRINSSLQFEVFADEGGQAQLFRDSVPVGSAVALDGSNHASLVDPGPVSDGPHRYQVLVTDLVGNTGSAALLDVTVDTIAPFVAASSLLQPGVNNLSTVSFSVVFTEPVTGVGAASFAAAASGLIGTSITGVSGSGANYQVTASTGSGSGTLVLRSGSGAGVTDTAGNTAVSGADSIAYLIDRAAPVVTSVSVPANGTYLAGQTLEFTVTLSEPVVVSGTPTLIFAFEGGSRPALYVTDGSTPTALKFRYVVQPGDADYNGIVLGGSANLALAVVEDSVGNPLVETLNGVPPTTGIRVGPQGPQVVAVGSSRVDLQACKLEYSIVSPK